MPLTPADVRNKQFNTTRLRPGYDEEEVDSFLDEVEAELDRLIAENDELRRRLADLTGDQSYLSGPLTQQQSTSFAPGRQAAHGPGSNGSAPADAPSQNGQHGHAPDQTQPIGQNGQGPSGPGQPVPAPTPVPVAQQSAPEPTPYGNQPEPVGGRVAQQTEPAKSDAYGTAPAAFGAGALGAGLAATSGTGQVPDSASRLLALAQQVHDEHVNTAQQKSDEMLRKARSEAEKLVSDARRRAEDLDRDSQEKHRQAMGSLITEREKLEQRIEVLRTFEREYRSRLKSYLQGQLEQLDKTASQAPPRLGE